MSKPDEHFSYRHPAQVQPHIQASRRYDLISKHADKQQQKTHVLHLETVPYQLRQQTHISKINQKKFFPTSNDKPLKNAHLQIHRNLH